MSNVPKPQSGPVLWFVKLVGHAQPLVLVFYVRDPRPGEVYVRAQSWFGARQELSKHWEFCNMPGSAGDVLLVPENEFNISEHFLAELRLTEEYERKCTTESKGRKDPEKRERRRKSQSKRNKTT